MVEPSTSQEKAELNIKHDWYQTESAVVITVLVKNIKEEYLKITFTDARVEVRIAPPDFKCCELCFNLSHKIVPDMCNYKLSASKIEIKLKKMEGIWWEKLEGTPEVIIKTIPPDPLATTNRPPSYPTSKKGTDWAKVEKDIKEQEAQEKPEGEDAINKLFQEIYGRGSDEVKKAMNKSYMESGGTVLSTNWSEICKNKVDVKPPDGMEFKKWND
ncbi:hypothetical protein JTB14_022592 [Gonioctena quinquepunctata]|nr:hypothetical protein JTB14_022592 [Gonioctena quinquepunctata]